MVTVVPTPSGQDADTATPTRRKSLVSNGAKENVTVAIRLRPLLAQEVSLEKATRVSQCGTAVFVRERAEDEERMFTFDSVIDESVSQETVNSIGSILSFNVTACFLLSRRWSWLNRN